MSMQESTECCPRFEPAPWDDKTVTWEDKRFLKDRVRSFFHIPLNFGAVMKRSMAAIKAAGAAPDEMAILSDENSPWGADVYIAISKDIPGASTTTLSGTFLSKVFEGPYQNMRKWIEDMKSYVKSEGKSLQKLYFFYTTCPKCARKYGKNYVVLLAKIN
ncbi:MAG: hydrolase [bacterium]